MIAWSCQSLVSKLPTIKCVASCQCLLRTCKTLAPCDHPILLRLLLLLLQLQLRPTVHGLTIVEAVICLRINMIRCLLICSPSFQLLHVLSTGAGNLLGLLLKLLQWHVLLRLLQLPAEACLWLLIVHALLLFVWV